MKIKVLIVLAFALSSVCAPVFAHHGNAEFDEKQSVTLKATIAELSGATRIASFTSTSETATVR